MAGGLTNPTAMALAPDGRIFVCEQGGALRVIKNGALLPTPFLTVTVDSSGERGLLGIAFDPNFVSNQLVYVYYTATTPAIHNRISRFTASGDVALAGSETILMDLPNLSTATNHNGGALHFGPDGNLFVAVGDNANSANSQRYRRVLARYCASLQPAQFRLIIHFSIKLRATIAPSGRSVCAIRLRSRSRQAPTACSSTTSVRTRGKRSTTVSPVRITVGPSAKASAIRRIRISAIRFLLTPTMRVRARSPAARFTIRRSTSFRRKLRRQLFLRGLLWRLDQETRSGQRKYSYGFRNRHRVAGRLEGFG